MVMRRETGEDPVVTVHSSTPGSVSVDYGAVECRSDPRYVDLLVCPPVDFVPPIVLVYFRGSDKRLFTESIIIPSFSSLFPCVVPRFLSPSLPLAHTPAVLYIP